jgi:CubicO group peptidase (beta-lactamase class C family)
MKFNKFPWLVMVYALAFFGVMAVPGRPLFAQGTFSNATAQARALLQLDLAPKVPGLTVAVAVNGTVVWSEGFGYADVAAHTPVTATTRFRIGSVSKSLTSAGLALLVERGKMEMDAPVQKYIPDFPNQGTPITIRQLAGHLSGIRNYRGREVLLDQPYPNLHSALKIFEDDPLESTPGTKFSYSSYNWNVIGAAMEAAAGTNFLGYMAKNVFQPLGMTNTVPDRAEAPDPQRTQFYEMDSSGKFIVAPSVDSSYKWPSGGFLSTADDLVRFGSALMQPGLLQAQSRKLLFTSQMTTAGKPTHYGVGWFIGRTILYHGGDSVGGASALLIVPSSHIVVAIIVNRGHLVFAETSSHLIVGQKTDLHLVPTAESIARIFGNASPARATDGGK